MRVPLFGGSSKATAVEISASQTINWVPEAHPDYQYQTSMRKRPGLATWANGGAAETRGSIEFGGDLYAVVGDTLKKVTTAGAVTTVGSLLTSTGIVGMAKNATQILVVDGVDGYTSDGSSLTAIADADFPNTSTHCAFMDTYFIVNDTANAGRFHISGANDGTAWDATDIATAQRDPDSLVGLIVNNRELWLLGAETCEVWYNSGNPDFPFDPIPSGFSEYGCVAKHSIAKIDGSVYWLSQNEHGHGMVMKSQGLRGLRISTHPIETRIQALGTISDAIAFTMQWEGHIFYVLTFPTGDATFVYDATTELWTEWNGLNTGRFRGQTHTLFNGEHVIGDYQDGNLFQAKTTQLSDAGTEIPCTRIDRHIADSDLHRVLFHNELEIQFEAGVGNSDVTDPQMMLRYSDDKGHTWSNELTRSLGKIGEYDNRVIFKQLGKSRDRVYEVRVTDNVKANIVTAWLDVEVGDA